MLLPAMENVDTIPQQPPTHHYTTTPLITVSLVSQRNSKVKQTQQLECFTEYFENFKYPNIFLETRVQLIVNF